MSLNNEYCHNVVHIYMCENEYIAIVSNSNEEKFISKYKLKGNETEEEVKIIKDFITWTALQRKELSRRNRINMQINIIKNNIYALESIKNKNHELKLVIKANKGHLSQLKGQLNNGVINLIWDTLKEIESKMRLY